VIQFPTAVVKVGGSLLEWPEMPGRLLAFLGALRASEPDVRALFIAGGGSFADLVRALDRIHNLGDRVAHRLALHAMDLTAVVLAQLIPASMLIDQIEALDAARNSNLVPIMAPRQVLALIDQFNPSPLRECWDTTSDSIAARIAGHLGAQRLTLLKSASLPHGTSLWEASRLGFVDPVLPEVARAVPRIEYLNLRERTTDPEELPA
jgi:aspartokinase-like uncharacterized kinase